MAGGESPGAAHPGLLLDACLSPRCAEALRAEGFDVDYVGDWPVVAADADIVRAAAESGRVIITLDKDFGELAVVAGMRHSGIVRLVNLSVARHPATCAMIVRRYRDELSGGAIVTVSPGRVRVPSGD